MNQINSCSSMFSLSSRKPCIRIPIPTSPQTIFQNPNPNPRLPIFKSSPFIFSKLKASIDDNSIAPVILQQQDYETPNKEVQESVKLLKKAAKTRKVPPTEILSAFKLIEKAKIEPSTFCETLGGSESPGRTWMLVFTAQKQLKTGKYFPITAVQRFDAAARRIENGIYLGPLGCLTFEGRFSWKKRILSFVFEQIKVKIGPFNPLEINIKGDDESEPSTKNPFFIWFYIDEEIAVARGRSGGTAFWCRCERVNSS